jgi:putrescine aminotransferase
MWNVRQRDLGEGMTSQSASRGTVPRRELAKETFAWGRKHLPQKLAVVGRLFGLGAVEVEATGCRVTLSDGRVVIDFGAYAVNLLGHRHPQVTGAVRSQLERMPVATRVLSNPVTAEAAHRLTTYLGNGLSRVYFGLSGADAVEAALKLTLLASRRTKVLAVRGGYHGKSLGALSLTSNARFRAGLTNWHPNVVHLDPEDPQAVSREVASGDVAALFFEPIQGENGVQPIRADVLAEWCRTAAASGVFIVADEIQTGLRRCGERSLALSARLPVDAVLFGKALGGGVLPLSAVVCNERMFAPLNVDPIMHTSTFGGHPLACAVLPTTLELVESLAARGASMAKSLASRLAQLRDDYPGVVADVRGKGLLWGIDFASSELFGAVVNELARGGLLVSPCESRPTTLRLLPPLVANDEDIDEAFEILVVAVARATR